MEYNSDFNVLVIVFMYLLSIVLPFCVSRVFMFFCLSAPTVPIAHPVCEFSGQLPYDYHPPDMVADSSSCTASHPLRGLYDTVCAFLLVCACYLFVDFDRWVICCGNACIAGFYLAVPFCFLAFLSIFSIWSILCVLTPKWWSTVPWSSHHLQPVFIGVSCPLMRRPIARSSRDKRDIRQYRRQLKEEHITSVWQDIGFSFFADDTPSGMGEYRPSFFCDLNLFPDCFGDSFDLNQLYGDQARAFSAPWVSEMKRSLERISDMPGVDESTSKLLEKIALWLISLSMQTSVAGAVSVTSLFVSSMYKKSTVLILLEQMEAIFGSEFSDQAGGSSLSDFRILLATWRESRNSELAQKLQKMFSMLVCFGVTDKIGLSFDKKSHDEFFKTSGMSDLWAPDLVAQCLETCLLVWDKGCDFLATRDIRSIFSSGFAAAACDREHAAILAAVPNYIGGTLAKLNITEADFDLRLMNLLDNTKAMHERAKGPERHIMVQRLKDLEKAHASIAAYRRDSTMRLKPFGVSFCGKTGQGKTAALDALCNLALRLLGYPPDKRLITSVNGDDKYQSDVSTRHVIVKFDDVANTKSEKSLCNPSTVLIDCFNNDVKPVLKADLNEKGKVFWNCKLGIVTTNVQDLDAGYYSNEPSSVLRRIEMHVVQRIKPAFATTGRGLRMVNPAAFGGQVLVNAWDFDIVNYRPRDDRAGGDFDDYYVHTFADGETLTCRDITLDELLRVFGERFRAHIDHQQAFIAASNSLFDEELCPHYSYQRICAKCHGAMANQVGERWAIQAWINSFLVWIRSLVVGTPLYLRAQESYLTRPFLATFLVSIGAAATTMFPLLAAGWLFSFSTYVSVSTGIFASFTSVYCAIAQFQYSVHQYISSLTLEGLRTKLVKTWRESTLAKCASLMVFCYAVISLAAMWKSYYNKHGDVVDNGTGFSAPKPDVVPISDFWTAAQPLHQKQAAPVELKSMTKGQVHEAIFSQLGFGTFSNGVKNCVCDVLLVCTNHILVPYHITKLTGGFPTTLKVSFADPSIVGSSVSVKVSPLTVQRIGKSDLALMYIGAGGTRKNLLKYFPDRNVTDPHHVVSELYRSERGDSGILTYATDCKMWVNEEADERFLARTYVRPEKTFNGLCGAVLISERQVPQIMGLHVKGVENGCNGVACCVTKGELEVALLAMSSIPIVPPIVDAESTVLYVPSEFGISFKNEVHERSPCHWLPPDSNIVSYGAHDGVRRKPKSIVCPTTISPLLETICNEPPKHGPSPFLGTRKIWYDNLLPMTFPMQLPHHFLNMAYIDRRDEILGFLTANPSLLQMVTPLDIVSACSGANEVRGVDRMPQNTSMGWPWCRPKCEFFIPLPPTDTCSSPLTLPPPMLDEIEVLRAILATKGRINAVFYACPKDEPTKIGKEKVRVFAACPWYLSILVRQYYLPIARLYLAFPTMFESAVGVNAHGPEWRVLVDFMSGQGSERMVFGDYEAFDKKVGYLLAILPWKLWMDIAALAGYDQESLYVMAALAEEICRPNYEFNGEVVGTDGTTPSGHNMTVFSNCEINCLYIRTAFYAIAACQKDEISDTAQRASHVCVSTFSQASGEQLSLAYCSELDSKPLLSTLKGRFSKYVNLLTYGDDNGMSVSDDVPWFNHMSIAGFLAECGIKYTTAAKEMPTVPYGTIADLSFLKRGARYSAVLDTVVAPLELASIYKSLHCRLENKDVTDEEYNAAAIEGALLELFFHGDEVYGPRRDALQQVVDAAGLKPWLRTPRLKTFQEQTIDWLLRYQPDRIVS